MSASPITAPPRLERLFEWLAIPTVSADVERAAELERGANWVREQLDGTPGAELEVRRLSGARHHSAIGRVEASRGAEHAPTIAVYGHFDVQPPGDPSEWTSAPFSPQVRDGWIYCRGAADSKANCFIVLEAVKQLAVEEALPVNVELLLDGEEEIDGTGIPTLAAERPAPDVAIVCDGALWNATTPCLCVSLRGTNYYRLRLRSAERELHSGSYGGAALNAAHAMLACLRGAISAPIGTEHGDCELCFDAFPPGAEALREAGARPADPSAAEEFYARTILRSAIDVNSIAAGEVDLQKTAIPDLAVADVSVRVGPADGAAELDAEFRERLARSTPAGADLSVELLGMVPPGETPVDSPSLLAAAAAFERVFGVPPVIAGNGGTLPLFSAYAARGVPTLMTGFATPDGAAHAADERFPLRNLPLGIDAFRALLLALAKL